MDASDSLRFGEAKHWLDTLLDSDEFVEVPILLLTNKQDVPTAVSLSEVTMAMGLDGMDGRVRIRGTSTVTGDGLHEAMMELHEMIQGNQQ